MTRTQIVAKARMYLKEVTEVWYEDDDLYDMITESMEWLATYLPLQYLQDSTLYSISYTASVSGDETYTIPSGFIKPVQIRVKYTAGGSYVPARRLMHEEVWGIENISLLTPDQVSPVYLMRGAKIQIWPVWSAVVAAAIEWNFINTPAVLTGASDSPVFLTAIHDIIPFYVAARAKYTDEEFAEADKFMAEARGMVEDLGGVFGSEGFSGQEARRK